MKAIPSAVTAFTQMLDPAMQSYIDQGKVVGMVYLIQEGDQVVHRASLGSLCRETATPMRSDALFRIGSMTKPITAAAIMMLVERGLVALEDPVSRFIPAFDTFKVLVDPDQPGGELEDLARPITVYDLLTHTSGLAYGSDESTPIEAIYHKAALVEGAQLQLPLEEMIARLVTLPLASQPGTAWRYSISFDVLGYLVELISDMPSDQFLAQRIFGPLGMSSTFHVVPKTAVDRLTAFYTSPELGDVCASRRRRPAPSCRAGAPYPEAAGSYRPHRTTSGSLRCYAMVASWTAYGS